ncbi:MAG: hypothetical protein EPN45_14260 [Rhizobiaceae bacterium]|nr:MAG: hypothetical protein EPN45_14260 [Rhizobiaceae bacterium]
MRTILILWAAPVGLFWGWYFLSLNDISFGFVILSRQVHNFVFNIYGQILGVDPAEIPGFAARACMFDAVLLAALYAFRRRRQIAAWWRRRRNAPVGVVEDVTAPGE